MCIIEKKNWLFMCQILNQLFPIFLEVQKFCAILEVNKKDLLQYSCKKNAKGIVKLGKKNKKVLRQSCNSIDIF